MVEFMRRLVSGGKARFRDETLDLELDLVYITDQVIAMGYPANGVEGLYRNRREDAKRFLDHRHGKNYWIFNFCPIHENSYDKSFFEGRVSRYPFPDHHAPPLAILPLVAREMRNWLEGSKDRVAVLHCKAGKGRTGTLTCAYLLSMAYDSPCNKLTTGDAVSNSGNAKETAEELANEQMDTVPADDDDTQEDMTNCERPDSPTTPRPLFKASVIHHMVTTPRPAYKHLVLHNILDFHTSRRMKPVSPPSRQKSGVSIPSQRRWLYYWSLLLANEGPRSFWSLTPKPARKIKITGLRVDIRECSTLKMNLVRAANTIIQTVGQAAPHTISKEGLLKGHHMWASLARYNDEFVSELEEWEQNTRDGQNLGKSRDSVREGSMFENGKWDTEKMVNSFARMSAEEVEIEDRDDLEYLHRYVYKPVSSTEEWTDLRDAITAESPEFQSEDRVDAASLATTLSDASPPKPNDEGAIILDAHREVRIKLYLGQIFLCWVWFIPAFHLAEDNHCTTLVFTREHKDLDFALGVGEGIVDVGIDLEWAEWGSLEEPVNVLSSDSPSISGGQTGVGAAVQAMVHGDMREAAIVGQATQN